MGSDRPALAPHHRLRWEPVRRRYVVVGPERAAILNETAAHIVRCCDGQRDVDEIVQQVLAARRTVESTSVREVLDRLTAEGILRWT